MFRLAWAAMKWTDHRVSKSVQLSRLTGQVQQTIWHTFFLRTEVPAFGICFIGPPDLEQASHHIEETRSLFADNFIVLHYKRKVNHNMWKHRAE
jgi:hypothetical protein